jgi:hypothetical protein
MLNNSSVHFTSAFTFEMWIKPTNACTSVYCHFLVKEEEYAFAVVNGTYQVALNGTSGGWAWQDTTIKAQIGSWQHIAFSHVANVDSISMYLNGLLVYTGPAEHLSTLNFATSSSSFQIGARVGNSNSLSAAGSQSFIGSIDEVKLWQTVRSQSEIRDDMDSYGPTNDSNLKTYFDFNDISGSTISNKASGGAGTLTMISSPTVSTLEITTVSSGTKVVKFPRSYISANGWKPPLGITSINLLAVGGGGGGGNNVGNGGGGGGGYSINNLAVSSESTIRIKVGTGGVGGRYTAAGTLTYNGTTLMDGQNGTSSITTVNGSSFTGGGGGGGGTIWTNNLCAGDVSGSLSLGGTAGTATGTSGTALSGATGGAVSSNQSIANGASGFSSSITGSSAFYGSAGGAAGGWNGSVTGTGTNSQGGSGSGVDGLDQTGSGGGGNAAGCLVGGKGGSGIVIFAFSAFGGVPTAISSATYRTATSISVTVSEAGKVSFYAFGKVIPGCRAKATVTSATITATCQWSPSQRNSVPVIAKYSPTSVPSSVVTIDFGKVWVSNRSSRR